MLMRRGRLVDFRDRKSTKKAYTYGNSISMFVSQKKTLVQCLQL